MVTSPPPPAGGTERKMCRPMGDVLRPSDSVKAEKKYDLVID